MNQVLHFVTTNSNSCKSNVPIFAHVAVTNNYFVAYVSMNIIFIGDKFTMRGEICCLTPVINQLLAIINCSK